MGSWAIQETSSSSEWWQVEESECLISKKDRKYNHKNILLCADNRKLKVMVATMRFYTNLRMQIL